MQIPIIKNYIKTIEFFVEEYGLQEGMRKLAQRYQTKFEVYGFDKETENILKTQPVVIAANHPYELETMALIAALPKREDAYLIINAGVLGIIPVLDKYLIPVYIRHHYKNTAPIYRKLSGIFIEKLQKIKTITAEEEHRKNIESIKNASLKVQNGGLVMIYPQRHGDKGKWYPGIGHLIKGIENKNAYYVQAYISGTSPWDYLRLMPFINRIFPTIKVFFDKPILVKNILYTDPKILTAVLENKFKKFAEFIEDAPQFEAV